MRWCDLAQERARLGPRSSLYLPPPAQSLAATFVGRVVRRTKTAARGKKHIGRGKEPSSITDFARVRDA